MIRLYQRDSVGIPIRIRRRVSRPSIWRRLSRAVDVASTSVQEWLEAPDTENAKLVANLVVGGTAVYLVAAVAKMMGR